MKGLTWGSGARINQEVRLVPRLEPKGSHRAYKPHGQRDLMRFLKK